MKGITLRISLFCDDGGKVLTHHPADSGVDFDQQWILMNLLTGSIPFRARNSMFSLFCGLSFGVE